MPILDTDQSQNCTECVNGSMCVNTGTTRIIFFFAFMDNVRQGVSDDVHTDVCLQHNMLAA